jgi:hypothetical protein
LWNATSAASRRPFRPRDEGTHRMGCSALARALVVRLRYALGMGKPAEERAVFQGFLNAAPMFAGAAVSSWSSSNQQPADIECDLVGGRRVGVQLTTWLDEQQMSEAKRDECIEMSLRPALVPPPPNNTEHFFSIFVYAKARLRSADAHGFRTELLQLIADLDKQWETEPEWQSPQEFQWSDFTRYPTLVRYLDALDVHLRMPSVASTMTKGTTGWLILEPRGGPYSPDVMVGALCDRVQAKVAKYRAKPRDMSEFYLLVHYDKAWAYNSPVKGIDFGYAEAVQAAATRVGNSPGVFDGIFVYVPMGEGERVLGLYAPDSKCCHRRCNNPHIAG